MAFDGITIACITKELHTALAGGRIIKISQPQPDALLLTIRNGGEQRRLYLSASASLPLLYLIPDNMSSPLTAPNFCMLLRKYIQNGRILSISQPGLERIVRIRIEHLNDLGDLCTKVLIIELMGKHSNLIFCEETDTIIDSIKHVSGMVSSVREVLPGRTYFIPQTQEKYDPLTTSEEVFRSVLPTKAAPVFRALYTTACIPLTSFADSPQKSYSSVSELLHAYYAEKNTITHVRQKSADLRRIVQTALERNIKKYDLQLKQIKDTEKKETYKIYGELLNTYGYDLAPGSKTMEAINFYTQEPITVPLDPLLTPSENAKKYFDRYGKLKRTYEALSELTKKVKSEIDHLESIAASLDIALKEADLVQIKEELIESGYIRRKGGTKKAKITSKPFHYQSSDGYDIYVAVSYTHLTLPTRDQV